MGGRTRMLTGFSSYISGNFANFVVITGGATHPEVRRTNTPKVAANDQSQIRLCRRFMFQCFQHKSNENGGLGIGLHLEAELRLRLRFLPFLPEQIAILTVYSGWNVETLFLGDFNYV